MCLVAQSCPTLWDPCIIANQAPLSMGILQARILEWVAMPFSRWPSQPGDLTQFFFMQADSLLSEPPGKPMNTGVGNLSLLQEIFQTQELNQGFLHCRRILYQLSYQGCATFINWFWVISISCSTLVPYP